MADVQIENGYTKIADELLEALYSTDFSEPQQRIIQFIIRYSYGCNKHAISLKNWNDLQNAGIAPAKIKSYLTQLKEAKVIFIDWNIKTIMINKNYDQWRIAPVPGYDSESVADVLKFNLTYNFSEQIIKTSKLTDSKQSLPAVNKIPTDSKQSLSPQSTPTIDNPNDSLPESPPKDSIKDNIKTNNNYSDEKNEILNLFRNKCGPVGFAPATDEQWDTLQSLTGFSIAVISSEIDKQQQNKRLSLPGALKYVFQCLNNGRKQEQHEQVEVEKKKRIHDLGIILKTTNKWANVKDCIRELMELRDMDVYAVGNEYHIDFSDEQVKEIEDARNQ